MKKEIPENAYERLPKDHVILGWGGDFPVPDEYIFQGIAWSDYGGWDVLPASYHGSAPDLIYACSNAEYHKMQQMLLAEVYDEEERISITEHKAEIESAKAEVRAEIAKIIRNTVGWGFIREQPHLYEKLVKLGVDPEERKML